MKGPRFACTVAACGFAILAQSAQAADGREEYLRVAKIAFERGAAACPEQVEHWRATYEPTAFWGYAPPSQPVWLARLAGSLYAVTGDEKYAREAAKWLSTHHEFKAFYPENLRDERPEYVDGLPTVNDFFQVPFFCRAYVDIKDSPSLTAGQRSRIELSIAESADFVFFHPEWGPMNRAMLRAEGLELAAQALPDHPRATRWRKMSRYVAADSRGKWSEEDAQIYQPVWMCSLIRHADLIGDETLFDLPQVRYYFDYFLNLLSPAGNIPDFGDGRWNDSWAQYAACLERAAAECGRADFKWAAARIYSAMAVRFGDNPGVRSAAILVDAYRWADDSIEPEKPSAGSGEVLDDLVGKKIVFRDGWDARATYLMLNYRDEGDYAVTPKEYLRQTIPVEEEKMHHGHADENSICLLMSGGSVLLHDGGYRSKIPSGPYGAFRADYFHNRLVARRGKPGREQPLFEFIRNSGAYEPVRTELIDFTSFDEVDVSRTRMTDAGKGVMCDRVIAHLKADDMFIVFDIVKMLQTGYYTFSTLWHATDVLEEGDNHYVTAIDAIQNHELPRDKALLIDFVRGGGRRSGTFPITRHWQDEIAVYQTISSHYHAGQVETFVTVLVPHERGSDVRRIVDGIELLETDGPRDGLGVAIAAGENTRYLCVKTDLARGVLTENVRPRYTFDSGRVRYGPFATDASFLYARRSADQLHYAATHLTRIDHDRETIFAAQPNTFGLQPDDLSTGYGPAMWRAWDDVMPLR